MLPTTDKLLLSLKVPSLRPLVLLVRVHLYQEKDGWNSTDRGKTKVLRANPVSLPLYPPRRPHELAPDRCRTSAPRPATNRLSHFQHNVRLNNEQTSSLSALRKLRLVTNAAIISGNNFTKLLSEAIAS